MKMWGQSLEAMQPGAPREERRGFLPRALDGRCCEPCLLLELPMVKDPPETRSETLASRTSNPFNALILLSNGSSKGHSLGPERSSGLRIVFISPIIALHEYTSGDWSEI